MRSLRSITAVYAKFFRAPRAREQLDGANQHLLGNSTARQTGSGEAFFFDNRQVGAEFMGFLRGIDPGGAATNHNQIEIHSTSKS